MLKYTTFGLCGEDEVTYVINLKTLLSFSSSRFKILDSARG